MTQSSAAFTFRGLSTPGDSHDDHDRTPKLHSGSGTRCCRRNINKAGGPAFAQSNQPSGAKTMPYQAKPLSLDPKSIKGISEKVLVSHYENNYVGAVKRLNAMSAQLAELDFAKAPNFMVNGLKREELIAANSMILHEIYFDGLGGGAGASGAQAEAIARDFGSVEHWRTEFVAMRNAEGGGSGW
jgi:Fe-Mn family superoxide dismutase